mgnify:FL=1
MTAQEIFDKAAVGLLTQKARSYTESNNTGSCAYRGVNKRKCAAGFCIDDSWYVKEMERLPIDEVIINFKLEELKGHEKLLSNLQLLHDCEPMGSWKIQLFQLARINGLSTEKIDNL